MPSPRVLCRMSSASAEKWNSTCQAANDAASTRAQHRSITTYEPLRVLLLSTRSRYGTQEQESPKSEAYDASSCSGHISHGTMFFLLVFSCRCCWWCWWWRRCCCCYCCSCSCFCCSSSPSCCCSLPWSFLVSSCLPFSAPLPIAICNNFQGKALQSHYNLPTNQPPEHPPIHPRKRLERRLHEPNCPPDIQWIRRR